MDNEIVATNGNSTFSVGAVLEIVAPFEFPYEGQTLKGKWYKYKTTTREYIRARVNERNEQLAQFQKIQQEIETLAPDDARIGEMTAECERLEEAVQRTNYSWLTDAIIEWNMVLNNEPVAITASGFSQVPIPLLVDLDQFLVDSRTDKNPTSSGS